MLPSALFDGVCRYPGALYDSSVGAAISVAHSFFANGSMAGASHGPQSPVETVDARYAD